MTTWNVKETKTDFFYLKAYCEMILTRLGLHPDNLKIDATDKDIFREGLTYKAGDKHIVSMGILSKAPLKKADVNQEVYYAEFSWENILKAIKKLFAKRAGEISYVNFSDWDDFLIVFRDVKADDSMWVIFSRKEGYSYDPVMPRIPGYLNKYFQSNSFILSYPIQASMDEGTRYLT